ncbi:MAG: hypothetical protein R3C68_16070 [Myxococcota bacterium]
MTASDGESKSAPIRAQVTIGNSPPTAPRVKITPEFPKAGSPLRCEIAQASIDADGDRVKYDFQWVRNGVAQAFASTSVEVPGRLIRAKDMWRCQVTPSDGKESGAVAESAYAIIEKD